LQRCVSLVLPGGATPVARNAARVVTVSSFSAHKLNDFGIRRRGGITIIPNGHEHVKLCCPDRSPFAAEAENRRAAGSPRSNASVPNQTLHAICARRVPAGPGAFSWKTSARAYLDLITSLVLGAAPEQKGEIEPSMQSAKALHD
ncbi:MAG: hypothetical protein WBG11_01070, partial [Methylocella sp.]